MIWGPEDSPRTVGGRARAGRRGAPAKKSRAAKKSAAPRALRARGAADLFAARDFWAGAPRRPARARPPTVRGESSGPQIILVSSHFILVLG